MEAEFQQRLEAIGAHMIVQCEQGLDMFVRLDAHMLPDVYEDWMLSKCCVDHAKVHGNDVLILQTNSDLDASRGIEVSNVSQAIFGGPGRLQLCAHDLPLKYSHNVGGDVPGTMIGLAAKIGAAQDKVGDLWRLVGISFQD